MEKVKPKADDITICVSTCCRNKCKRHEDFLSPADYYQSYTNPTISFDEDGKQLPCGMRLEELPYWVN